MTVHADNAQWEGRVLFGVQYDFRNQGGGGIFTRGTGGSAITVSFPTFTNAQGLYDNPLDFVNAYGVPVTLSSQYDTAWAALLPALGGNIAMTMLGTGVYEFRADAAFTVKGDPSNTDWGFGTADQVAVADGAEFVAVASTRPKWGNVDGAPVIETTSGAIDLGAMRHHSPFVANTFAAQVGGLHLEALDNAAIDTDGGGDGTGDEGVRWYVTEAGHVGWAAPTGTVDAIETWGSTVVRKLLGWTGNETVTTASGLDYQVGERPAFHAWRPSRHVQREAFRLDLPTEGVRLTDGSIASQNAGSYEVDSWTVFLDGPADSQNDYPRIAGHFLKAAFTGARISIFQAWPEHRALQDELAVDVDTAAYSTTVTSQGRYFGRIDASMAIGGGESFDLAYPSSLRRSLPMTLLTQRR